MILYRVEIVERDTGNVIEHSALYIKKEDAEQKLNEWKNKNKLDDTLYFRILSEIAE